MRRHQRRERQSSRGKGPPKKRNTAILRYVIFQGYARDVCPSITQPGSHSPLVRDVRHIFTTRSAGTHNPPPPPPPPQPPAALCMGRGRAPMMRPTCLPACLSTCLPVPARARLAATSIVCGRHHHRRPPLSPSPLIAAGRTSGPRTAALALAAARCGGLAAAALLRLRLRLRLRRSFLGSTSLEGCAFGSAHISR